MYVEFVQSLRLVIYFWYSCLQSCTDLVPFYGHVRNVSLCVPTLKECLFRHSNELTIASSSVRTLAPTWSCFISLKYCTDPLPFGKYFRIILCMRILQYAPVATISVLVLPSMWSNASLPVNDSGNIPTVSISLSVSPFGNITLSTRITSRSQCF